MRTLYEITADWQRLDTILDECEGETSRLGEREQAVTEWMDSLAVELPDKIEGYVMYDKQLTLQAAACEGEIAQWKARLASIENRQGYLRNRVRERLLAVKLPKVVTPKGYVVRVQANGGNPPLKVEVEATRLPVEYRETITTIRPNTIALRAALAAGKVIPGVTLEDRGSHLRIELPKSK